MKTWDCIHWLWDATKGFRGGILLRSAIGMVFVVLSLTFVYLCKNLIDIATGHQDGSLWAYVVLLASCMLIRLLFYAAETRLSSRMEIQLRNRLQHRLFDSLMETCWTGRDAHHSGDVLNRLENDIPTVTGLLCTTLPAVLVTIFQFCGAFYYLIRLDSRLAYIVIFIMPVALLFSKTYIRTMRRLTRNIRSLDSRVQSHVQEHLQHRILVRTLEYTERATGQLGALQGDLQGQVMKRVDFSLFSRFMVQLGFTAGYLTAFIWGVMGIHDGTVTYGMMTAFLQLVSQIQNPMVDLSQQIPAFVQVLTSAERLEELERLPQELQGDSVRLPGVLGVRLEDVSFTYPGGQRKVLDHFTHDFTPGSLTAVVGETGAGKSTMMRLILALLQPQEGTVCFYNTEQQVEATPLTRCNLSYVPQGNTLLSGTIRDNLCMGKPDATDEELKAALHTAVADFVLDLPEGLDSLCGEGGVGLSEGQAQRIAIARGLLRPGTILLLDEPTSSVDRETEAEMLSRLGEQVKDKTLILITHRDKIANLCNYVVRIERA